MHNLQPRNREVKRKPAFIIYNSPAWLDQHQDWISDGARKLYKTLRTLMDQRTGRLFIPGRGWIRISTIEQKSQMCEETRLKYTRELLALGAVQIHRDYVTRRINGRYRKVLGQAQITVLPLHPPKVYEHRAISSTTPGNGAKPPHKHSVSTTPGSTTPGAENGLLHQVFPGPEETGCQDLSKSTSSAAGSGSPSVGVSSPDVPADGSDASPVPPAGPLGVRSGSESSSVYSRGAGQVPTTKPDVPDPLYEQKQRLAADLESHLYFEICGWTGSATVDLVEIRKIYKEKALALDISWRDYEKLYHQAMQNVAERIAPAKRLNENPPPVSADGLPALLAKIVVEDGDCLDAFINEDGVAVMVFADGEQEWYPGECEPVWQSTV